MNTCDDGSACRKGVAEVDGSGSILRADARFCELLRTLQQDSSGAGGTAQTHCLTLTEGSPLQTAVESGKPWNGMAGTVRGCAVRASFFPLPPLSSGDGKGGIVMLEQAEPPRQLRADMLRFARGLTHEFNNTLASIQGFAEIAASLAADDSSMQSRALQNILRGCEHAEAAIRTARIMAGRAEGRLVPLDLVQTVQVWLDERRGTLPERVRVSLIVGDTSGEDVAAQSSCQSGHHALLHVPGDSQLLGLALDALWDNALHALSDGGEIVVNVSSRDDGAVVALEVLDTGSGMTADVLAACADPYFTTRESEGAKGLGLSLARGIAWLHNGNFFVESSPEKGTMVRLLLPRSDRTAGSEIATYRVDAGIR